MSEEDARSSVLFKKDSGESQVDIWDDSALIKAYEKSVQLIKKKLNSKLVISEKSSSIGSKHKEECEDKEENRSEDESQGDCTKWKVLDLCTAVYSEDGLIYPATIQEIYEDDAGPVEERRCRIQYLDYLNEEEKYLHELLEYNEADYFTGEEIEEDLVTTSCKKELKDNNMKQKNTEGEKKFSPFGELSIPPPPPPPMLGSFLNKSADGVSPDNDALYSMLLSWYMSGYHTGYYFGKTQK